MAASQSFLAKSKSAPASKATFISYVDNGRSHCLQADNKSEDSYVSGSPADTEADLNLTVDLLPGELVISEAPGVTRYVSYSEDSSGCMGTLFVTSFRVSFVTVKLDETTDPRTIRVNKLLGPDDFALTSILALYQVSKGRRKKLQPGQMVPGFVKHLEVHCMDFRIHSFSFQGDRDKSKSIVNAVIHHAFPTRLDLLFAFSFKGNVPISMDYVARTREFLTEEDWRGELRRLNASGFRLTKCNKNFELNSGISECFVVPESLSDSALKEQNSFPLWSYSHSNGAALVRMAHTPTDCAEEIMVSHVKHAHPMDRRPAVFDVSDRSKYNLPTLRELQMSYERLHELCTPPSCRELEQGDAAWLSALEGTQWPAHVSAALTTARCIVETITFNNRSVIIKERSGADMTPLVGSLAQLLMDPYSRSVRGLQELVEREWCALGHRMRDRCCAVETKDSEQGPVFLLFLDCLGQLSHQFPSSLAVSEFYLTSLWDSVSMGLFRNFVFNSARERRESLHASARSTPLRSPLSVWDWTLQFDSADVLRFANPLYAAAEQLRRCRAADVGLDDECRLREERSRAEACRFGSLSPRLQPGTVRRAPPGSVLWPRSPAPAVRLWQHCYLRWLTPVQIVGGGGSPSEFFAQARVMDEIDELRARIDEIRRGPRLGPAPPGGIVQRRCPNLLMVVSPGARERKPLAIAQSLALRQFSTVSSPASGVRDMSDIVSSSYPFSPVRPTNSTMPFLLSNTSLVDGRLSGEDTMSVGDFCTE